VTSNCRLSEQSQEGTRPVRGSGRACVDACGLRTGTLRAGCDDHRMHDRPDHALGWAGLAFVRLCLMPDRETARLQHVIALRRTGIRNGSPRLIQLGAVAMA
jgi:hypothetical protein